MFTCSSFGEEAIPGIVSKDSPNSLARVQTSKPSPSKALAVYANREGAFLHCAFQKLEGKATTEGIWITTTTTTTNSSGDRFRLNATGVGRKLEQIALSQSGMVRVGNSIVSWERPGLTECYSVSVDGIRQDFSITQAPAGEGALRVELALCGARAEATSYGAKLTLDGSRRELAYSGLCVTDAKGKQLSAKIKVFSATRLAVSVDDGGATYPVRIDPTFSDANWVSLGGLPGVDPTGTVDSLAVDTNAGLIYIAGTFDAVGTVIANNIAKWNGTEWSALGSGVSGGTVSALAADGAGNLYAGGTFTNAGGVAVNYIARWNGSVWSALGSGMEGGDDFGHGVSALAVDRAGNLYAGGDFTVAGGIDADYIAKWNGSTWSALASGMNEVVYALALDGAGNLYAGGYFIQAGGSAANCIAKWNGGAWSALGSGMNGYVTALAVDRAGRLYAGGPFTTAGGVAAANVARWTGTWSALGSGVNGSVLALATDTAGNLYAGGNFTAAGGVTSASIAKWNGGLLSSWSTLGSGIAGGQVNALAADNAGNVYAGGSFTTAGTASADDIAQWNGNTWSALGSGTGGGASPLVTALAVDIAGNLYAGGSFAVIGGVSANNIARWNGTTWTALGSGISGSVNIGRRSIVNALAVDRAGRLYAGGTFTNAGGVATANIAQWNGSTWSALGSGVNSSVFALALDGSGSLYAGGYFTAASASAVSHLAKWDGGAWSALGSGINPNGSIWALVVDRAGNLYAGGYFTNAGGVAANHIAEWNGNAWSALGSGMASLPNVSVGVSALAVDVAGNLYAGGFFATAGGVTANNIAEWNGSTWFALGSGVDVGSPVQALGVDDSGNLYAGGNFFTAGGLQANRTAKWDGSAWSSLGSGVRGGDTVAGVEALVTDGAGHLYVGGGFTIAGSIVSAYVAQANIMPVLSKVIRNSDGSVTFNLLTTPGATNRVLAATNLTPPVIWEPIYTNVAPGNGTWQFTDTNANLYPIRFYRSSTP
jgi:hypothetical protein